MGGFGPGGAKTYEKSPLYRRKLDEAGIDPRSIGLDDLSKLPFTTKDEVRRSQEVSRIHASSGTAGKPTLVGATVADRGMWNDLVARCIASLQFLEGLQRPGAAVEPGTPALKGGMKTKLVVR